jgi:hypothetical protein
MSKGFGYGALPPPDLFDYLVGGTEEDVTKELNGKGYHVVVWDRDGELTAIPLILDPSRVCMTVTAGKVAALKVG